MICTLKVIIRILQFSAIHPLAFDFNQKQFKKCKFLQIYSVTLTIFIFIVFFYTFKIFKEQYMDQHLLDIMNIYCLNLLFASCFGLILTMLYQQIFKRDELVCLSNELLTLCDITNREIIKNITSLAIVNFLIMPLIMYFNSLMSYFEDKRIILVISFEIFLMSYVWSTLSGYPFVLKQFLLLKIMRRIEQQVCNIIDRINYKNKNYHQIINDIKNVIALRSNLIKLTRKTVEYHQMNILLIIVTRSCNCIRKIYRIVLLWRFRPQTSPFVYFTQTLDVIVTSLGFIKLVVFVIYPAHSLWKLNVKIKHHFRRIDGQIANKVVKEKVTYYIYIFEFYIVFINYKCF